MSFWAFLLMMAISLGIVAVICIVSERLAKGYVPIMIAAVLAGVTIIADITASAKLIELNFFGWELVTTAGIFAFPVILLGFDYLNEFYGKDAAKIGVWGGFMAKVYMALMLPLLLSDFLPAAGFALELQDASRIALAQGARIGIASIIAYFLSGFTNVYVYSYVNKLTKGTKKTIWIRNNVSSNVAMLFDSILFILLAFAFTLPWPVVFAMIWAGVILKWLCNWLDTIFLYAMYWFKENGIISGEHHKKHKDGDDISHSCPHCGYYGKEDAKIS